MSAAVEVRGLTYAHPGGTHRLDDVNLTVEQGEVAALLGPNGVGKTTLLRCMLGMLPPHTGSVRVRGRELSEAGARERARLVAYVPQSTATVFPFTALDMAVMGRTPHLRTTSTPSRRDRTRAREVLEELGLDHLADRPFASLSGGERGLTLVARALVQESEVMILDEPTAALDLGNAMRVLTVIGDLSRRGHTILLTTHQPDHALRIADRVIMLARGGTTIAGAPSAVMTAEALSAIYGIPIDIGRTVVEGSDTPFPTIVPRALTPHAEFSQTLAHTARSHE